MSGHIYNYWDDLMVSFLSFFIYLMSPYLSSFYVIFCKCYQAVVIVSTLPNYTLALFITFFYFIFPIIYDEYI